MARRRGLLPLLWIVLLAPFAIRAFTWPATHSEPLDDAAVAAGETLFSHEWQPGDPLAEKGDGLGPVFNANSCVACHRQGAAGGGGPLENNVTAFRVSAIVNSTKSTLAKKKSTRDGVVHAFATDATFLETLFHVHASLPEVSQPELGDLVPNFNRTRNISLPQGVHLSQRNTPALFGAKLIDEIPDREIIAIEREQLLRTGMVTNDQEQVPVGRALRMADGRVGRFGWKAQIGTLSEFVQAACANELGLGNPNHEQPASLAKPNYKAPALDLTQEQCDQMTAFIASLPQPVEKVPEDEAAQAQLASGKELFHSIGCADCHVPNVGTVKGIYSDLLLHRMGKDLVGGGSYGEPPPELPEFVDGNSPASDEWRTPPLWGVADSAPYLHDGRAPDLIQAIALHAAQGARAAGKFRSLSDNRKGQLLAFLESLRAPRVESAPAIASR